MTEPIPFRGTMSSARKKVGAKKSPKAHAAMNSMPIITRNLYLNLVPKPARKSAVTTDAIAIKESSRAIVPGRTLKVFAMSTIEMGITISIMADAKTATSSAATNIILGAGRPIGGVAVMFYALLH